MAPGSPESSPVLTTGLPQGCTLVFWTLTHSMTLSKSHSPGRGDLSRWIQGPLFPPAKRTWPAPGSHFSGPAKVHVTNASLTRRPGES